MKIGWNNECLLKVIFQILLCNGKRTSLTCGMRFLKLSGLLPIPLTCRMMFSELTVQWWKKTFHSLDLQNDALTVQWWKKTFLILDLTWKVDVTWLSIRRTTCLHPRMTEMILMLSVPHGYKTQCQGEEPEIPSLTDNGTSYGDIRFYYQFCSRCFIC